MTSDEQLLMKINGNVERIASAFEAHIDNPVVHQAPPCKFYTALVNKMWGLLVVAIGGAITGVWALLTTGKH